VTLADSLGRRTRTVLSLFRRVRIQIGLGCGLHLEPAEILTGALQFAIDIHPLTDIAVIPGAAIACTPLVPAPHEVFAA
jgi:hypothetical protein